VVDAAKQNLGDAGGVWTLENVDTGTPASAGAVLYWDGSQWTASALPSPADGSVYLGGDGAFHSVSAITAPSISLFNYMHFI
jgi:hypothetical protein